MSLRVISVFYGHLVNYFGAFSRSIFALFLSAIAQSMDSQSGFEFLLSSGSRADTEISGRGST